MTRKDYQLIAEVLSKFEEQHAEKIHALHKHKCLGKSIDVWQWNYAQDVIWELKEAIADALEADNPRFDSFKFRYAASTQGQREQYDIMVSE